MTAPYVPPPNDPFRAYVRQRLQQRLQEMGAQVTPDYLEQAVEKYSQPGSILRKEYFEQQAAQGRQEAADAQLGARSPRDVLERTVRDASMGIIKGITSPGRFVLHAVGADNLAKNLEDTIDFESGSNMGGRGLSSNPVLGTLQEAVEPGAEMAANAKMIGNRAFTGAGNLISNLGARAGSPVLRALSAGAETLPEGASVGARALNVLKAAPRAMAKGVVGSTLSMPDETLSHGNVAQNLAYAGVLAAPEALGAARLPSAAADASAVRGPGLGARLGNAYRTVNSLFESPTPERPTAPTTTASPRPAAVQAEAPTVAQSAASPRPTTGPRPMTGGEPVDWAALTPEGRQQVEAAWQGATTLQARAKLLGVEGEVLGAGGKKLDPRIIDNISRAKTPSELMGYLQRRLVKASGVEMPRAPKGAKVAASQPETPSPVGTEVAGQALAPTAAPTPVADLNQLTPEARAAEHAANQAPAPSKRVGIPKRKDVLATAPRLEDGAIDWDRLTTAQQQALTKAGMFGKSYAGKLAGKKMAQIQSMLSNAQWDSFYKALHRQAKPATAPGAETPVAGAPAEASAAAPVSAPGEVVIQESKATPRNRKGKLQIVPEVPEDNAAKAAALADMQAEGLKTPEQIETELAGKAEAEAPAPAAEATPELSAAGWDALNQVQKIRHLSRYTGEPAAMQMSQLPYEDLPAKLRAKLQGDPELASDLSAARGAEGGEPPSGAPFPAGQPQPGGRGKARRPRGKRK